MRQPIAAWNKSPCQTQRQHCTMTAAQVFAELVKSKTVRADLSGAENPPRIFGPARPDGHGHWDTESAPAEQLEMVERNSLFTRVRRQGTRTCHHTTARIITQ